MLSRFRIRNYRSIRELTVDFSYGEGKAPNGHKQSETLFFIEKTVKERFVPCLAFYGANASGKTNILRAMDVFCKLIKNGVSNSRFDPNLLNPPSETSAFALDFYLGNKKFSYEVEYDADKIYSESLYGNGKQLFNISTEEYHFENIETEKYQSDDLINIYNVEGGEKIEGNYVKNFTFLSIIGRRFRGLNEDLTSVYDFFTKEIFVLPANQIPPTQGIDFLANIYTKKENIDEYAQDAFNIIINELKKFDIDIVSGVLKRSKSVVAMDDNQPNPFPEHVSKKFSFKNGKLIVDIDEITTLHKDINGNLVPFNFYKTESTGTRILVGLLGILLKALHDGNVVMIDELDRSLHPFLLHTLIRIFKSKRRNGHGAQLIFTVHDVYLLEDQKLRVSEVGIVRKTLKNGTTVVRLCEDTSLRNVSNFKQLYLDGAYGGIPFPYI